MKRKAGLENIALRLATRECQSPRTVVRMAAAAAAAAARHRFRVNVLLAPAPHPPTLLQAMQCRRYYENVVPDKAVPGLVPPLGTVLSRFSPCGRFLLAFQPVPCEVVAYRFNGLQLSLPALGGAAEAPPPPGATPQSLQSQALEQQPGCAATAAAAAAATAVVRVQFSDVFEEQWRCCPCPSREEQLSSDLCIGGWATLGMLSAAAAACAPVHLPL